MNFIIYPKIYKRTFINQTKPFKPILKKQHSSPHRWSSEVGTSSNGHKSTSISHFSGNLKSLSFSDNFPLNWGVFVYPILIFQNKLHLWGFEHPIWLITCFILINKTYHRFLLKKKKKKFIIGLFNNLILTIHYFFF